MIISLRLFQAVLPLSALLGQIAEAAGEDDFRLQLDHYRTNFGLTSSPLSLPPIAEASQHGPVTHADTIHHFAGLPPQRLNADSLPPVIDLTSGSFDMHVANYFHPSSSQENSSPEETFLPTVDPEEIVAVPELQAHALSESELYHIFRTIRYKLDRLRVNPRSLRAAEPLPELRNIHLNLLRSEFQQQLNARLVHFVTPTADHRARIFATPIHSEMFKNTVFGMQPTQKVALAVFSIHDQTEPSITWLAYYLLEVQDPNDFYHQVLAGKRVRALRSYLLPSVA